MLFDRLLGKSHRRAATNRKRTSTQQNRRRLLVPESLETRSMLAAVTYVNDDWFGTQVGDDPDGTGPATVFGTDSFATVQAGVNSTDPNGTVNVLAGVYSEDVSINIPGLRLLGEGPGSSVIRGAIGGPGATINIGASNVEVAGFTLTREGNNTTDWDNPNLNFAAIAWNGQGLSNILVRDNLITGNRTGIDVNNSSGHTIRNNVIENNRTGLLFRNATDNLTVTENAITNNHTVGVLFLDASSGTNSPVQSAVNSVFTNNNISGNWYGQIVDRQTGGALPAPGTTNLKNFSGNWFGTTTPIITTANSAEPGYGIANMPAVFGGTATAPGGQPDIAGTASANFDITPMLGSGVDSNVETMPGRGTYGFQGNFGNIIVTAAGAQTASGRIQEGVNLATVGGTVNVVAGTYVEDVNANKTGVRLLGAGPGNSIISGAIGGTDSATVRISASNVELAGFTITREGNNPAQWNDGGLNLAGIAMQGAVTGALIHDNLITGNRSAIDINNSSGHTIWNNVMENNRSGLILRNATDNLTVEENAIVNNHTVGVLFLDASGGTNSPVQSAANSTFRNNNISGNWYGQIVDRQTGGALPTPGTTNLKNFSGNWFGTTNPVITTADSAEPGYAALIPVAFGGTATAPGGQPDIAGAASANFDITPMLGTGVDTNVETAPGRGTYGFQGSVANLVATAAGAQTGATGRIQEAVDLITTGGTVNVAAGSYTETVIIPKTLALHGAQAGVDARTRSVPLAQETVLQGIAYLSGNQRAIQVSSGVVGATIDGFYLQNTTADPFGAWGPIYLAAGTAGSTVRNNILTNNNAGIFLANNSGAQQTIIERNLFKDNTQGGLSTDIYADQYTAGTNLQNVLIRDNAFTNTSTVVSSWALGLSNTSATPWTNITFQGNTVSNKGRGVYAYGTSNSTITQNTFSNATNYAVGLFDAVAANVNSNIAITNNTFTNNFHGIRVQDGSGTGAYAGTLAPTGNTFTGGTAHLVNQDVSGTTSPINAIGNTFDGILLDGSTSIANIYNIADKITDAVDVATFGSVILRAGEQFVTPNSFSLTHGTTTASIQRAIDAAGLNDTVRVKAGSYTGGANATATDKNIKLSAGASPAQIVLSGDLVLNSGDTLDIEIDGTNAATQYDNFIVTGGVTLGNATLTISGGYTPGAFDSFTLINNDPPDTVSGTFNALPAGTQFSVNGTQMRIFYSGNDGNDVVLVPLTPTTAYVDDAWAAFATGTFIVDADLGTTGDQSALFGYNAFSSINTALSSVTTSGTVIVNGGTYAEAVNVDGTRTLEVTGPDLAQTVNMQSLASVAGASIIIEGGSALTITAASGQTIAGTIAGSGSLMKQGTGNLTLSGANTLFTGAITVSAGGLLVNHSNALGTAAGHTTVAADGAWVLLGSGITIAAEQINIVGNGDIGAGTFSGALQAASGTATWGGPVRMDGAARVGARSGATLIVSGQIFELAPSTNALQISGEAGSGKVVFANATNSYGGPTQIVRGTLQLGVDNALPITTALNVHALGTADTATFDLNGFNQTVAELNRTDTTGGTSTGVVTNSAPAARTLTVNQASTTTFNGVISGNLALTKAGAGALTLSGTLPNSYSGTTTVNAGTLLLGKTAGVNAVGGAVTIGDSSGTDTLRLLASDQIPDTTVVTVNAGGSGNSGKLELNGFNETVAGITATNAAAVIQSVETAAAAVNPSTLTVNNTADFNFAGIIRDKAGGSGAAVVNLIKNGTASLTLSGSSANAYSGTTTINAGTLLLNKTAGLAAVSGPITIGDSVGTDTLRLLASNQIADTSVLTINAGGAGNSGKFELNGFSETVAGISATNAAAVIQSAEAPGAALAAATLTVNNTANFSFAGIIRDKNSGSPAALNLVKSGTGTLTFTGGNTYTGTTTVNGGTLLVNGTSTGTGAVAVTNATLGGTGSINGSTTVNGGGKITGGTLGGVGTLTINNSLFFNGGTYAADFNVNTSDKLVVTGAVDMASAGSGAFTINGEAGIASDSTVFTLIDKTSAGAITDPPLTGAIEGTSTTVNGKTAYFTYAGGDGNNFTLSVAGVPVVAGAGNLELRRVTSGLIDNVQLLQNNVIIDSRPLASIAGSYTVNASAGADSLLINYTSVAPASGFIPRNVVFNAGGAGDSLEVRGTDFSSITNAFTNSTDATVTLAPTAGGSQTINYTGLEGALLNPNSVSNLSFSLPATADAAILEDDAGAVAGRSQLRSTSGSTFTTTAFNHATSNLSLTGGAGDSVQIAFTETLGAANFSVTGVDSIAAGFVSTTGNVTLSATGAITDLGADAATDITASQLSATAGAGIDVDTAIATLVVSTTGINADVVIDEADDISVTSITTVGDNSDLRLYSVAGNISQTGAISQTGLSSNGNIRALTADKSITLAHPANQFQGEVTLQTSGASGNATIVDTLGALVLSINSIGGFLNALSTGGNIEQTLTTFVVGGGSRFETTLLNADILLATQTANNFVGPVALFTQGPSGDVFILDDNGLILTTSSISGNLTAMTGGLAGEDLIDSVGAAIVVGGISSFTAGAANVVLDSPTNNFNSVGVVSSNNTHVVDTNSLALNLLNATTQVRLQAGASGSGAITDNNIGALNIVAPEAAFTAAGGIGATADPLDTDVDRIAALNTVSGDIVILNDNTPTLTIDVVAGLVGVRNLGTLGSVDVTTNGSLVVAANSEATANITLTTGETAAASGENLSVSAGVTVQANTGDVLLEAGDDFNIPTGASLVALGANRAVTLQSIDGPAGAGSTFNFTGNIDASRAFFRAVVGNPGEDTFNMAPDRTGSVLTPIDIFGELPTVAPGDVLNLNINGLTIPTLMLGPGANNGQWTFTPGQAGTVTYNSIETVNTVPAAPYNLVLDMDFANYDDGNGDLIEVDLQNSQSQLRIRVNGAVAFLGNDNVINSLTILGSTDAETLRMLADSDNFLPTEGGGLTGALAMPSRKLASAAMNTSTRGPSIPSVYFNGNTGGADQLEVVLGISRDVAHFSDQATALFGANAGDVSVRPAAGGRVGMFMTFATLEDLTLTGAGGPLLVDATSTPDNSLLQIDNIGGAADGVSRVTGNNGFVTTTFSNFTSLYVTGGAGDDTINLVAVDGGGAQPLTSVTLDGSSTFTGVPASAPAGVNRNDEGHDTIQVQSLPAGVPALLLGGLGRDTFRLHDAGNTVDNILSQVTIDGEDGNIALAADNDQLFVIDSGDLSGDTLHVTETTINGLTGYTGAGMDITYSRIDRIDVTATGGADTITVDMDNGISDLNTAVVRGSEGQDQFFVAGVENFVGNTPALPKFTDLFLYGDGPNDTTQGDNFGTTAQRIRPSKTVVINIDGGVPSPVAPPGNIPGDRLNLTMAQGGSPLSLVEATSKTPVLVDTVGGTATSASHAAIKFKDIEWVDLVDLDGQTNVQRGDLYVRASEGADRIVLYPDTFLATRNTVRLRYNTTDIGPLNQTNTSVTSPGKFIAYGRGGNDQITINNTLFRDSELYGQLGNDYLVGSLGGGRDLLVGGSGADRLQGLTSNDILWGDRRPGAPETPTDTGIDGADQLNGGSGNDVLDAGGGNDKAYGEDGDDIVRGGEGNDTLGGDRGRDIVLGGGGNDKVNGGYDRDLLIGGLGIDTVDGDQEQDVVIGDASKWDANTAANDVALVAFLLGTATPAPPQYWANMADNYNTRTASSYLRNLLNDNIEEDNSIDTLVGDLDFDWYFDVETAKDKYSGKAATEKLN